MRYPFVTADVFTDRAFGGNPLAVIVDADGLDDTLMQNIAREFNLSETVFLFPPEDSRNTRRVRIFTPARELPFAGHPTVGAACVLAATGEIPCDEGGAEITFEEGVGPVPVSVLKREGAPAYARLTSARLPQQVGLSVRAADAAAWLSLQEDSVLSDGWQPEIWSCGVPYLFVPLRNLAAVRAARPPIGADALALEAAGAHGIFPFCAETESADGDVHGRMFAPDLGIAEDPATGGAAAAMAGHLAQREKESSRRLRWHLEQGFEMGRPSRLEIEAERGPDGLRAVRVGGSSVLICRGEIDITGRRLR